VSKKKSILKTFRFPEPLAHSLQKEAADEGTNVNAQVNSIIRQHFEWDKKARESGFTMIEKAVLKALVDGLDEKTLERIGREVVPNWYEEMANYWFHESSPERILDTISLRFKFDPLMQTKITREENEYVVVFHHDLGPKWSVIAESAARALTKKFFHIEPQISRGNSVVTARFKVNLRDIPT